MSLVSGLAAIKNAAESQGGGGSFLKLKPEQTVKVWFLQELDDSSPHYNEEAGLGVVAVEYRDPKNFRKRILDTTESEGRCWPAEQGWRPRLSLYINVLVEDGDGNQSVKILNQGLGSKTVTEALFKHAEENESITNIPFKIHRKGSGKNDTSYSLAPILKEMSDESAYDGQDLVNFAEFLKTIPYDEQEAFFRGEESDGDEVQF